MDSQLYKRKKERNTFPSSNQSRNLVASCSSSANSKGLSSCPSAAALYIFSLIHQPVLILSGQKEVARLV